MAKNRAEFDRAAETLHRWLDSVDVDDTGEADIEEHDEALGDINVLAWAGAADSEVSRTVARARHSGCTWAPIAVALGVPRQRARDHYGSPPR